LGSASLYVAHGDLVDRSDWGYLALRAFYRSLVFRAFVRLAPGRFLDWLGRTLSRLSRERKPLLPTEMPIKRRERLRKIYRSFAAEKIAEGFDFVILGHCHDLDEMEFRVADRRGHYANMGYPREHGSYLVWEPGDPKIQRTALPK
jgi:UDP-2,3-diacylglucosamine pyrophosphatase LpxH